LASPEYRKSLALSLFYKFLLYANKNNLGPRFQSAFESLIDTRDISSGTQNYPTNPTEYPVSKPIPKLNA
jgi:xanthine dehydrogenase/oxidase